MEPPAMSRKLTRREFVQTGTAAGVALSTPTLFGQAPAMQTAGVKPIVVASNNGNVYKNGGAEVSVQKAFNLITKGTDVLAPVPRVATTAVATMVSRSGATATYCASGDA